MCVCVFVCVCVNDVRMLFGVEYLCVCLCVVCVCVREREREWCRVSVCVCVCMSMLFGVEYFGIFIPDCCLLWSILAEGFHVHRALFSVQFSRPFSLHIGQFL